jgi:hypothetical protein
MSPIFDLGLPNSPGGEIFGLWEPVTDRFIVVVDDSELAKTLKLLCSSRYTTFVVDIAVADNYYHTIIDNSCCHAWTLSNKNDIFVSDVGKIFGAIPCISLQPAAADFEWSWPHEMTYFQTCLWWLRFLKGNHGIPWYDIDRFIARLYQQDTGFSDGGFDKVYNLETAILRHLHEENDVGTMWSLCEKSVQDSDTFLRSLYERYHTMITQTK